MLLLCYQSCVWFDYTAHPVSSSAAFAFLTNASRNVSTSLSVISVKKWQKTISI